MVTQTFEYDIIESRDVVDDVSNRRAIGTALCHRLPIGHETLNRLVPRYLASKTKVADTHTDTHRLTIRVT